MSEKFQFDYEKRIAELEAQLSNQTILKDTAALCCIEELKSQLQACVKASQDMHSDLLARAEKAEKELAELTMVASEFIRDWHKGDFTLPKYAELDAMAIEQRLLGKAG